MAPDLLLQLVVRYPLEACPGARAKVFAYPAAFTFAGAV